jgi:hypothetical protein
MHDVAHHLVERVLPDVGIRQYILARVHDVDGRACLDCAGQLLSVGAVLPPASAQWIREQRIVSLLGHRSAGWVVVLAAGELILTPV